MDTRTDWQRRMGVGESQSTYHRHAGTTRTRKVPRDDGPGIAGTQTDHWSGRVDAKVTGATVHPNPLFTKGKAIE